ncbi:hypothetical protein [Ralstonia pseudosolanacearum]
MKTTREILLFFVTCGLANIILSTTCKTILTVDIVASGFAYFLIKNTAFSIISAALALMLLRRCSIVVGIVVIFFTVAIFPAGLSLILLGSFTDALKFSSATTFAKFWGESIIYGAISCAPWAIIRGFLFLRHQKQDAAH